VVDSQRLPLLDVVVRNARVVAGMLRMARHIGNHRHSFEADHALQRQIGLVSTSVSNVKRRQ
jgi:hypothetical protein